MEKAIVDEIVNPIAIQVMTLKALEVPRDPRRRKKSRIEILTSPVPRTNTTSIDKMSFLCIVNRVASTSQICTPLWNLSAPRNGQPVIKTSVNHEPTKWNNNSQRNDEWLSEDKRVSFYVSIGEIPEQPP